MSARKKAKPKQPTQAQRSMEQVVRQIKVENPDWIETRISAQSDITRNKRELLDYSRSLVAENPYIISWLNSVKVNVHGPKGIRLRMCIKETEDRVIASPEEKALLVETQERRSRVAGFLRRNGRQVLFREKYYREKGGKMIIEAGAPDVFANTYVERRYADFGRKENYTVTGRLTRNQSCIQRTRACIRDGEHFLRFVRNQKYKYGIKIQHINAEWCDPHLTCESKGYGESKEGAGNPIRHGIEYDAETGMEIVAYWFIKADPKDYMNLRASTIRAEFPQGYVRYLAADIIHYAMHEDDSEISRPAPWIVPVIGTARNLTGWMQAAVKAARVGACTTTFLETDLNGEDPVAAGAPDPRDPQQLIQQLVPGGVIPLPPGVKANVAKPNYPNQDVGGMRNESVRELCAPLPGASHATQGQNYAETNFSAGRLDRLATTGEWMMLQEFDIETAERRIFEEWLKAALLTGAIKLPAAKFDKFNQPHFQGRRWPGVDPIKEIQAAAMAVSNKFTTRTAVIESGIVGESGDFEETILKLAEEEMMLEALGMSTATTADTAKPEPEKDDEEDDNSTKKPKKPTKPNDEND